MHLRTDYYLLLRVLEVSSPSSTLTDNRPSSLPPGLEDPHVFQRAIANARLVHGYNPQVLIQAGHPWLGGQGCNCLASPCLPGSGGGGREQIAP